MLAPGLFSTTTFRPRSFCSSAARMRACASDGPPAGRPSSRRSVLPRTGKSVADACVQAANASAPQSKNFRAFIGTFSIGGIGRAVEQRGGQLGDHVAEQLALLGT